MLWVRLNRPEARNGINMEMCAELQPTFAMIDDDPEIRAVIVTGQDRTFCTGGDLMPAGGTRQERGRQAAVQMDYRRAVRPFQELFRAYWRMETPVVSAVNGTIAGAGWMLALLADLVVGGRGRALDARVLAARHGAARGRPVLLASDPAVPPTQRGDAALRDAHVGDAGTSGAA